MKATLRLWTAVMALVCVSLQVSALPYSDSRVVQENSLLSLKRTKPSLSIVNPLDVLRQRIILEMARRQMRENTRQVELNKALLREIGKRSSNLYDGSEYPVDYTYYDRKLYNQHVASKPDHASPAEEELEAMVENLLQHNNRLAAREGNYGGKYQRTRSVNERQTPASRMVSEPMSQQQQQQQQAQSQQLSSLFNNEQEGDLKTKDQALRQEPDNVNLDTTEDDVQEQQEQSMNDGSSSGVLKAIQQDGNILLDQSSNHQSSSDRNSGTDFGPRYVYGMYKNRYAN
ncbi:uncharacterized protein LOC126558716 [Anopheles maculipalpis]|uniref:uncharacterized protein LOC126558716 n=1 Tax=Anopheles maculipalpis TaxID=1496333 RepID=UPI002158BCC2|nr:uncharacterized protein LOC126558716 [Anopheles maculipalpis]